MTFPEFQRADSNNCNQERGSHKTTWGKMKRVRELIKVRRPTTWDPAHTLILSATLHSLEMVGWHYWLNEPEFEQTPWDGEGQGSLACCSPWGHKELNTMSNNYSFETLQKEEDWKTVSYCLDPYHIPLPGYITSPLFTREGGTVLEALAYSVPPLPGKEIKPLFLSPL